MILLFGGGGQLGQEFVQYAIQHKAPLLGLSRRQADISDTSSIARAIALHSPTLVLNAAAYTNVDGAESNREAAFLANARGAENLALACRAAGIPLVHFSTDYVFDGAKEGAYVEDDPAAPLSVYGRSKLAGEDAIRATHPMHLILRTAWLYGVFGKNFLKTMLLLARERDEIRVVADQHGNPTSTAQIAKEVFAILPRLLDQDCPWGTYHLAATDSATWFDLADRAVVGQARHTGRRPVVTPISSAEYPTVATRPRNTTLDSNCFLRTFGGCLDPWMQECDRIVDTLMNARP